MAPLAPAHDRSRSTPTPRRPVADDHERIVPTLRPIDSRPPGPRPHRATTLTLTILSLGALAASSHLARADPPPPTSPPLTATASNTAPASRLDLKAEADRRFRAGELADAAALWAQLGAPLEPGSDRHLLIWKALGAWERAFAADHDHRHLCAARDLAQAVLRDHLRQDHRLEFELRLQALDRALADLGDPTALCIAKAPALLATNAPSPSPPTTTAAPKTSAAPSTAIATSPSPAATPSGSAPPTTASTAPTTAPSIDTHLTVPSAAQPSADKTPTALASPGRPYVIAGAVTLPLGAALLGLMTYAILEDARQIAIVNRYDAKNQTVGLTPDEAAEARDALARARAASYLTLGSGIAGAALTLTGTALLIQGQRQRRRHLALLPALAPTGAALTLSGRF